jgi:hypothetical protein
MWGRLGPRFALEAAFLILLAVGLGLADVDWIVIVAVMAAGWAVVSLIELVASRRSVARWPARRDVPAEPAAVAREAEPASPPVEVPPPAPVPVEQVVSPEADPAPPLPVNRGTGRGWEGPAASTAPPEDTLEVPQPDAQAPPARRRWFRRRKDEEIGERVPEPPKHVRKLDPEQAEEQPQAEPAEGQ